MPPPPQPEGGHPDRRDHRAGSVHARVHSHSLRLPRLRQLPGQRVSTDAKKGPATSALPPLGVRAHPWAVPLGPPTHLPMARPVPSPGSDKQPPGPLHQLHRTSWASLSVFSAAAQGGRLGGTSAFTPPGWIGVPAGLGRGAESGHSFDACGYAGGTSCWQPCPPPPVPQLCSCRGSAAGGSGSLWVGCLPACLPACQSWALPLGRSFCCPVSKKFHRVSQVLCSNTTAGMALA